MNERRTQIGTEARTVAVIIGRAGSKGLPGKNRLLVGGRPMVAWSIDHARHAVCVDEIVVSTDCAGMKSAARELGVETVDRPAELASDLATVDAAVRHAIAHRACAVVVVLYGNVPIRPAGLIDRAVELLVSSGADSVQSYCSVGKYHPYWEVRLEEHGEVRPFVENNVYRRQDLPPLFVPDGGVIAVTRGALMSGSEESPHAFLGRDRRGIVTEAGAVIDIDSELDLRVAEAMLTMEREAAHVVV